VEEGDENFGKGWFGLRMVARRLFFLVTGAILADAGEVSYLLFSSSMQ
jgi:hypothetical protein